MNKINSDIKFENVKKYNISDAMSLFKPIAHKNSEGKMESENYKIYSKTKTNEDDCSKKNQMDKKQTSNPNKISECLNEGEYSKVLKTLKNLYLEVAKVTEKVENLSKLMVNINTENQKISDNVEKLNKSFKCLFDDAEEF